MLPSFLAEEFKYEETEFLYEWGEEIPQFNTRNLRKKIAESRGMRGQRSELRRMRLDLLRRLRIKISLSLPQSSLIEKWEAKKATQQVL